MKDKHLAGWITALLIIVVGIASFPDVWFGMKVDEFIYHSFDTRGNVRVEINAYHKDKNVVLETERDKNVVLSAMKREMNCTGTHWYRYPIEIGGQHRVYEITADDWIVYMADDADWCYMYCGDLFNAKLEVSEELLQILDEYTG